MESPSINSVRQNWYSFLKITSILKTKTNIQDLTKIFLKALVQFNLSRALVRIQNAKRSHHPSKMNKTQF